MIYYYCPDHDVPSWGVGMLYYHVQFLHKNGFTTCILHNKPPFKLSWLQLDVPVKYMQDGVNPNARDILVVPEFYVADKTVGQFKCRKILFVQNSFILFERIDPSALNRLGYEAALYYMPHLRNILTARFKGPVFEAPPFIADYYFKEPELLHQRRKNIIIYPKTDNRDYNIMERLLRDDYPEPSFLKRVFKQAVLENEWKIVVMKNFTHFQVAKAMQDATFFINLNTHEAFNSSVPEAMAAGCINFTYDAFGPADFLVNNKNGFVFNNNHVFPLYEKLRYYTIHFDEPEIQAELNECRRHAYETAKSYTTFIAERAIIQLFNQLVIRG